jgi:hypothetical protein
MDGRAEGDIVFFIVLFMDKKIVFNIQWCETTPVTKYVTSAEYVQGTKPDDLTVPLSKCTGANTHVLSKVYNINISAY